MILAAAGVALVGVGLASSATADPLTTGRILNGVGSDTTQDIMNTFSKLSAGSDIASWDALGSAFDTGNAGCTAVPRQNGSTAGRDYVKNIANTCVNFARSSSFKLTDSGTVEGKLGFYPFAIDGLTYAVTQNSSVPKSLTKDELVKIFSCDPAVASIVAVVPQDGSGTRADWLKLYVNAAGTLPASPTCYRDGGLNASLPQEHDGRTLKSNEVMPYSTAKWVSQMTATITDVRGKSVLGLLDVTSFLATDNDITTYGTDYRSPVTTNAGGSYVRTMYNAIRGLDAAAIEAGGTLTAAQTALKNAFVGSTSVLCSAAGQAVLINNGFAPITSLSFPCGTRQVS